MTKRQSATPAPAPLEAYCQEFDPLFGRLNQREDFRRYLQGLLLPTERNKTLTALANTEPIVGAQNASAQKLQWFLSEANWDWQAVNEQRLRLLCEDELTAPNGQGVLVIDESGDRKWGNKTDHVGRQYIANIGKIDNGVVSVTSLWADEQVYWPIEFEPYTPAHHFERGKHDPNFRTKPQIALELVGHAVNRANSKVLFQAVVADCFYGEHDEFKQGLDMLGVAYVLALKPSHSWWHHVDDIGSLSEVAQTGQWQSTESPGRWSKVERNFRDEHTEEWWALEAECGPYGPTKRLRAVIATTDPEELPDLSTWYLLTNLPEQGAEGARAKKSSFKSADLAEVVRLYGLRSWIEQSYKQTKHSLGWNQYQVRGDIAIRRHWELVFCAFSFCWYEHRYSHPAKHRDGVAEGETKLTGDDCRATGSTGPTENEPVGWGENRAGVVADMAGSTEACEVLA